MGTTWKTEPRYLGGRSLEALMRYKASGLVMPSDKLHAALSARAVRRYVAERIRDLRGMTE